MFKSIIVVMWFLCLTWLSACAAGPSARLGFIDHKGNIVVDLEPYHGSTFQQPAMMAFQVENYSDGMAYVTFWNQRKGFFDKKGKLLETTRYYSVGEFHEGLASCTPVKGGQTGFIDKTGKLAIEAKYSHANAFSEGLASCLTDRGWIFVDKQGKQAIDDCYQVAENFSDGLADVKKADKRGWIDRKGKFIAHPDFWCVYPTSCGI
ncbi:MAG: WG repeat-containing protein, partial [Cyanobacteria bacterium SZAS LIN-2]|nr:WG repeat-containing protein [Cyanobacteria bacterium SZAS LIN-2]